MAETGQAVQFVVGVRVMVVVEVMVEAEVEVKSSELLMDQ